jgi:hypothetical protein
MTFWQALGALIMAAPLIAVGAWVVSDDGWRAFATIFGGVAVMLAVITLGAAMVSGNLP